VDTFTEGGAATRIFGAEIESVGGAAGSGEYLVNYKAPAAFTVAGCAVVAASNEPGAPHFARGAVTGSKQITVKTYNTSNALEDVAFSLTVTC
jgi:hypothetical protein